MALRDSRVVSSSSVAHEPDTAAAAAIGYRLAWHFVVPPTTGTYCSTASISSVKEEKEEVEGATVKDDSAQEEEEKEEEEETEDINSVICRDDRNLIDADSADVVGSRTTIVMMEDGINRGIVLQLDPAAVSKGRQTMKNKNNGYSVVRPDEKKLTKTWKREMLSGLRIGLVISSILLLLLPPFGGLSALFFVRAKRAARLDDRRLAVRYERIAEGFVGVGAVLLTVLTLVGGLFVFLRRHDDQITFNSRPEVELEKQTINEDGGTISDRMENYAIFFKDRLENGHSKNVLCSIIRHRKDPKSTSLAETLQFGSGRDEKRVRSHTAAGDTGTGAAITPPLNFLVYNAQVLPSEC